MNLSIACADVGSTATGKFGWAVCDPPESVKEVPDSSSITAFADAVIARLRLGRSVALGFECPLFVPLRTEPSKLTRARVGEGNRPWSAGAGCGSLTTGIVQTAWVLDRIRRGLTEEPRVFFRWSEFTSHSGGLFFWEAFVSGAAKSSSHTGDAILAVRAFASAQKNPEAVNVVTEPTVYSLIGAALLRTGWAVPTSVLSAPCTVIRV